MNSLPRVFFLVTGFSAVLLGCGGATESPPEVVPVTGVLLNAGKPVANADIAFTTPSSPRIAAGKTDSEGKFTLTTFTEGDGAVPGDHSVTVVMLNPELQQKPGEDADEYTTRTIGKDPGKSMLPQQFASPLTTPLKATVKEGETNNFTFDLAKP